jgi:protein involved in polysaccharide export with SLBB domain
LKAGRFYPSILVKQEKGGYAMKRYIILGIWQVLFLGAFLIPTVYADFGLMLGSFKNQDNAQKYLDNFIKEQPRAKGNAFLQDIQMPGKGIWYRVCLGPFVSREDALRKQEFFQSRGHDSVIVSVKTSEIPHSSRNSSGSNSSTPRPSSGIDTVHSESPPLVSANASMLKDVDNKSIRWSKVDASLPAFGKKTQSLASSPKMEAGLQGEDRSLSESQEETVIVFAGDILSIEIPDQKQMSHEYDVDPDGRIFIMSEGEVKIGGLDLSSVEKKMATLLKQLIPKEGKLVVRLVDSMRYINISGGVNYPGWYRVPHVSNLDDLVERAGGLVSGVDYSEIKLRRATHSGFKNIKVRAQVSLEPNDILMVPTPKKYERKIDSGDLLFINIPERQSEAGLSEIERKVTQNQIEVDKSGYIYIPDYGHIYVNNLMPTEVGKLITNKLPKYLARSAKVHVNIIEKRHYVQIGGHVVRPGWYNIPESENIQASLSAAGGAVDGAIMSRITVTRRWGGKTRNIRINLYQFTVTGDIRLLTPVHENDSIFVPISSAFGDVKRTLSAWMPPPSKLEEDTGRKVRIFGAVENPGVYESKEDMNILDLLIKAGGNLVGADLAKTLLIREDKTEAYDLNTLILQSTQGSGKIPKIQNGDSVYIGFMKMSGQEITEPKKMVRIFGGVKKPGIFEPTPDMNLMDIFSLAKGGTYDADLTNVMVMRTDGNMRRFDLQEYLDNKDPDPSNLPKINASDTIYVAYLQHLDLEKKEPIYLLGKVESPGQYDLAEGNMTVYQMLAYAGGLTEWADTENIMIIRMVDGRQRNIPYNLRRALSGKYPELNIRLRSFDTIYVP